MVVCERIDFVRYFRVDSRHCKLLTGWSRHEQEDELLRLRISLRRDVFIAPRAASTGRRALSESQAVAGAAGRRPDFAHDARREGWADRPHCARDSATSR